MRGSVRRWLEGRVALWFHGSFRVPIPELERHGLQLGRAEDVLTWALDRDVVSPKDVYVAPECPWSWIQEVHGADYLMTLDDPATLSRILAVDRAIVPAESVLTLWRRAAGAVVAASRHALGRPGRRAAVLSGGFHHAAPNAGGGFCGLNDVAIAIRQVRADGFDGRIAVVDVDAHPPDGTAACVHDAPAVSLLSVSVASGWPVPVGGSIVDRRVPGGSGDDVYLDAIGLLADDLRRFDPALVFLLAGADPLEGDPLGGLACTEAGLRERDRRLVQAAGRAAIVAVPAGGYTAGAWRIFAGTLAELAGDRRLVPPRYDPIVRRIARVSAGLDPVSLGLPPADALIREEDLAGILGYGPPAEPRLLGAYTRQGLELGLTRHGLWPAIERMGFSDLHLDLDDTREPHRVTVTGRATPDGPPQRLVDLALSTRVIEDVRLLMVDWCELRDPRLSPPADQLLPGQVHPGLGLARETGALLEVVAQRLGLSGVVFLPAYAHVLWAGRDHFTLVDPALRGAFEALGPWMRATGLNRASRRLAEGLTLRDGAVWRWEPSEAIAPLDERARALVSRGAEQAERARAQLAARLP